MCSSSKIDKRLIKKEFEDKRPETVSRLLLQKRQKAIGELLAQLRGDSEIIIEEGYE